MYACETYHFRQLHRLRAPGLNHAPIPWWQTMKRNIHVRDELLIYIYMYIYTNWDPVERSTAKNTASLHRKSFTYVLCVRCNLDHVRLPARPRHLSLCWGLRRSFGVCHRLHLRVQLLLQVFRHIVLRYHCIHL